MRKWGDKEQTPINSRELCLLRNAVFVGYKGGLEEYLPSPSKLQKIAQMFFIFSYINVPPNYLFSCNYIVTK